MELIDPGVEQILGLVQQISNLAKPEESRREELDLVEELEKILDTLKHLGVVKHSKVVRDFIHPLPRIQGDPGQIEQVFRNLIVNSAQAMEASREKVLGVSLRPSPDGGHLQAVVSDTGPGIPPEHLERIFQPFFTTKEEGKGTGLGLPIVKSILDRHDASIRIESKVGAGTHFYLSFPVAD